MDALASAVQYLALPCLLVLDCAGVLWCGVVADCRGELPRRLDQDQRRQLLLHADHLRLSELCAALGHPIAGDSSSGSLIGGQVVTADDLPRLRSSGVAGAPLVLSGADMRFEWLAGFDLRGAVMRGCRLGDCVLRGADLAGCTVAGADLSGAVLDGADLGGVDLSTLSSEAVLPARLAGCELTGARLGGRATHAAPVYAGRAV